MNIEPGGTLKALLIVAVLIAAAKALGLGEASAVKRVLRIPVETLGAAHAPAHHSPNATPNTSR